MSKMTFYTSSNMIAPVCSLHLCKYLPNYFNTTSCVIRNYSVNSKMALPQWQVQKNIILELHQDQRRKTYKINNYLPYDHIDTWSRHVANNKNIEAKKHTLDDLTEWKKHKFNSDLNKDLVERVSIFKGDITTLEVDAIVNAANSMLRAGGGVDGAIHKAAGRHLQEECSTLGGCPTGDAKVTGGYDLPARYVIHTVGPQDGNPAKLKSCYEKCLSFQKQYQIRTIAFPCISTGIYGFPNRLAAHIALSTARKALEESNYMHRIIFCTFMPIDVEIYETLMQMYFPVHQWHYNDGAALTDD